MADQDLEIHVKSDADLSGIKEAGTAVDDLAARTKKVEKAAFTYGYQGPPVPPELLKKDTYDDIKVGYAGITAGAKAAEAETKAFALAGLLAGTNISRARNEATTLVRELAAGAPTTRTLGALLGTLPVPLVIAGVAAAGLGVAIKNIVEQDVKLNEEVDKGLTSLIKSAEAWRDQGRDAKSYADVLKVAESGMKAVDAAHDNVTKKAQEQFTLWHRIVDTTEHNLAQLLTLGHAADDAGRGYEKATKSAATLEEQTVKATGAAIRFSEETVEAFQAEKLKPTSDAMADMSKKIDDIRAKQRGLNTDTEGGQKQWIEYQKRIEAVETTLKSVQALGKERLDVEDQFSTAQEKTSDRLNEINSELLAMGVNTRSASEAFSAGLRAVEPYGALIRRLAREMSNLQGQATKLGATDLFKPPAAAQLEAENRQRQHAAEIATRREQAAEGVGTEVNHAEELKFQREEELRLLQRQQALQRSLIPPGGGAAETLKALGKEGERQFEWRERRIRQLNEQLGNIPAPGAPQIPKPPEGFDININTGELVPRGAPSISVLKASLDQTNTWLQKLYQLWT